MLDLRWVNTARINCLNMLPNLPLPYLEAILKKRRLQPTFLFRFTAFAQHRRTELFHWRRQLGVTQQSVK